jgi:hypothetical protein
VREVPPPEISRESTQCWALSTLRMIWI